MADEIATIKAVPVPLNLDHGFQLRTVDELHRAARIFVVSGMFAEKGANSEESVARAMVKVLAGQELGLSPIQSMRGIHVLPKGVMYDYKLVGALIKRSGKYDYKVLESTSTVARIQFFENGQPTYVSEFTIEDAKRAKLLGKDTYQENPTDMLFARAMGKGANKVCPEIFFGEVGTEQEINAESRTVEHEEEAPPAAQESVKPVATELPAKSTRTRKQKEETTVNLGLQPEPEKFTPESKTIDAQEAGEDTVEVKSEPVEPPPQIIKLEKEPEPVPAATRQPLW